MHLAGNDRRDGCRRPDLNHLGVETFLPKKSPLLSDKQIDGCDAAAGIGDDHFVQGRGLRTRERRVNKRDDKKQKKRRFHSANIGLRTAEVQDLVFRYEIFSRVQQDPAKRPSSPSEGFLTSPYEHDFSLNSTKI